MWRGFYYKKMVVSLFGKLFGKFLLFLLCLPIMGLAIKLWFISIPLLVYLIFVGLKIDEQNAIKQAEIERLEQQAKTKREQMMNDIKEVLNHRIPKENIEHYGYEIRQMIHKIKTDEDLKVFREVHLPNLERRLLRVETIIQCKTNRG